MPALSEAQRIAMAIAEHNPEKLYERNKGMSKMTQKQLHDFATKKKGGKKLPYHVSKKALDLKAK